MKLEQKVTIELQDLRVLIKDKVVAQFPALIGESFDIDFKVEDVGVEDQFQLFELTRVIVTVK